MIQFQNVTKQFNTGNIGLDSVSLSVDPGEFVFLVGASGAGKTTLLRMLIMDSFPNKGKIYYEKILLNSLPDSQIPQLRRSIGMIFQDFKLLEDRTIFENVILPLEIAGHSLQDSIRTVERVLNEVGLIEKVNMYPIQLSAGELQRIALARALVLNPKVILADEPTGNLDPETSKEIISLLKTIHKQGKVVIIATHDQAIVDSMNERVITLDTGRVKNDQKKGKYQI